MNLSSTLVLMGGTHASASSINESLSYLGDFPGEILLVLSSSDQSLQASFPQLKCIVIDTWNAGYAANEAMEIASGDALFFVAIGGVISLNGLEALEEELTSHPSVGAVAPLGNTSGWQSVQYFIGPQSSLNIESPQGVSQVQTKLMQRFKGQAKKVKSIEFCGLGISKKLLSAIGGFDTRLSEDHAPLDLAWRIGLMGKELRVVQSAYLYFSSWQDSLRLTIDPTTQKQSQEILSEKLKDHYGSLEQIPSSWDLWEVEHFQVSLPEKTQFASMGSEATHSTQTPAIVLYASHEDINVSLAMGLTLQQLKTFGVSSQDILLIDASENSSGIELEDRDIITWSLNDTMGWSALFSRLKAWFPTRDLLVMRAGSQVEPHSWRHIITQLELPEQKVTTGELYSSQGEIYRPSGSVQIFDWTSTLSRAPVSQFLFPASLDIFGEAEMDIHWVSQLQFKADFNVAPVGKSESESGAPDTSYTQSDSTQTNPVQSDSTQPSFAQPNFEQIPTSTTFAPSSIAPSSIAAQYSPEVQAQIQAAKYPAFWFDDQYLDIDSKPISTTRPDLIVLTVEPLDMPALSAALSVMNHPGLTKIIVIFKNNYVQIGEGENPYDYFGVSPYDVRREIELAGFRKLKWSAYQCQPQQEQAQYACVQINTGLRTDFEILMSTATSMMVEAEICQPDYDYSKKVSIVVLGLNKIEYTAKCIESTNKYCKQNIEWILVNNGSTDGTRDYFDQVPGAKVIHNTENLGVAAGWNQGMKLATGDYILILNNDVILAPGSIENLVRCAMNHPNTGVVAPRSNTIAGPQMIEGFEYQSEEDIPTLLENMMKKNDLSSWQFPMIKGFCMLLPQEVVSRVGYFDEQFGYGNFEDDDYSQRIAREGYELRVANDSIIFHFGSVSFGQANIDWDQQMIKNQAIYDEKWINGRSSIFAFKPDYEVPSNIKINNTSYVSPNTKVIKTLDQLIEEESKLKALIRGDEGDALTYRALAQVQEDMKNPKEAFQSYCRSLEFNPFQEGIDEEIITFLKTNFSFEERASVIDFLAGKYPHLKAFKSSEGDLNQSSENWIDQVQGMIENRQFDEASQILEYSKSKSAQRYEWFNFKGLIAYYEGAIDQAYEYFKQGLSLNSTEEDMILNLFDCGLKLRLVDDVEVIIERALSFNANLVEARKCLEVIKNAKSQGSVIAEKIIESRELNLTVENYIREGLLDYAMDSALAILEKNPNDDRALNNKGLIHWYQGEMNEAIADFSKSLNQNPWYTDAILNLYDCSLLTGNLQDFTPILEKCLQISPMNPELIQVRKEIQLGQIPERLSAYQETQKEDSREKVLLAQAQELIQNTRFEEAVMILTDLLNEGKELAEAYNALGIISFYWKNYEDAHHLVSRSLSLQPLNEDALLNYWDICLAMGEQMKAREVLSDALSMDPGLHQVAAVLQGGAS